jgi:thiol-disulfide isomerase/thioredoxin
MPDFRFVRMSDGRPFTRNELNPGKKTLFVFFDTECPHCMQAVSAWNDNHTSLNGINTVLLTMDPPIAAIPFLKNFADKLIPNKNLVTAIDPNRQFIARFLPKKYPSMFLFSEKGDLLQYTDEEKDIPSLIRNIRKK